MMNTLLGLKEPEAGIIRYFGQNRRDLLPSERREINNEMGVLFQGGALFSSMTVRQNIMVPLREHTDISVKLMRELADMKIHMVGLPSEAATLYPADLSGGMKKRAGLARSLALDPEILFLDEPTAGLDPIGANAFDELILGLREAMNLTVLMVTHDLDSLYAICDRVAVLVDKHIAIADTLAKVMGLGMENKAHYALIGTFVLLALFAVIAFVSWLSNEQFDTLFDEYEVTFNGAVRGVSQQRTAPY